MCLRCIQMETKQFEGFRYVFKQVGSSSVQDPGRPWAKPVSERQVLKDNILKHLDFLFLRFRWSSLQYFIHPNKWNDVHIENVIFAFFSTESVLKHEQL